MIYLIDFENVHEEGFSALGRLGDRDAVYCFFTRNVAKISMSALAGMRSGQLHFVEAESGKQSLDLALVSFLGYLIGTRPQEQFFEIVSNDNGFQKVAEFWNKRGNGNLRVRVRKTTDQKPKAAESDRAAAEKAALTQPAVSVTSEIPAPKAAPVQAVKSAGKGSRRGSRASARAAVAAEAAEAQSAPANAEPAAATAAKADVAAPGPQAETQSQPASQPQPQSSSQPKSAPQSQSASQPQNASQPQAAPAEEKTGDPAVLAALTAAGITQAAAEFLLAQAEKYRNDKNIKQLVYRAVVKKYGQKNGTQIYNTAKKIVV